MQDNVAVARLLKGALKGLYQVMGQLSDKAHRICQKDFLPAGKLQCPRGGIEGGKQHVLGQNPRVCQIV